MKSTWVVRRIIKSCDGKEIKLYSEFLDRKTARDYKRIVKKHPHKNRLIVDLFKSTTVELVDGTCYATYMEKTY